MSHSVWRYWRAAGLLELTRACLTGLLQRGEEGLTLNEWRFNRRARRLRDEIDARKPAG
jgi:hypothetical protein